MASDPASNATGAAAERYTPAVATAAGGLTPPTNQELSNALRFLFDLA
jgi:hypothetical protein